MSGCHGNGIFAEIIDFLHYVDIRSMEPDICPIAVLCFAINVLSLTFKTVIGQHGYKFYHSVVLPLFCHMTSSVM